MSFKVESFCKPCIFYFTLHVELDELSKIPNAAFCCIKTGSQKQHLCKLSGFMTLCPLFLGFLPFLSLLLVYASMKKDPLCLDLITGM